MYIYIYISYIYIYIYIHLYLKYLYLPIHTAAYLSTSEPHHQHKLVALSLCSVSVLRIHDTKLNQTTPTWVNPVEVRRALAAPHQYVNAYSTRRIGWPLSVCALCGSPVGALPSRGGSPAGPSLLGGSPRVNPACREPTTRGALA